MFKHLGLVVDQNQKPVNHRSVIKILLNPLLRCIGLQITTPFTHNQLGQPTLARCNRQLPTWQPYNLPTHYTIIPIRRFL